MTSTWRRHYNAALAGDIPAEALPTHVRGLLVSTLHRRGLDDVEIAAHTRMTTYTAARIRADLGLPPHRPARHIDPAPAATAPSAVTREEAAA